MGKAEAEEKRAYDARKLKPGDVIKSPWGTGVVLSREKSATVGFYILWVDFSAHGLAKSEFRLENVHSDESDGYYRPVGFVQGLEDMIENVRKAGELAPGGWRN